MSISLSLAVLCAALHPQDPKPGRLVLPPQPKRVEAKAAPAPQDELTRFHKEVLQLRRTVHLSQSAEQLVLQKLSVDFQDPGALALELLAKVNDDEAHGLMKVLARYPSVEAGKHLHYLLLTRAFGEATPLVVETMSKLLSDPKESKAALFDCVTAKFPGVRQAATDRLLAHVDTGDLPQLDALARERSEDIARRALTLFGAVPGPEARARLLTAITNPSVLLAAEAYRSLVAHGPDAAPDLIAIVERPAQGRGYGYATLALVTFEDQTGKNLISDAAVPHLKAELAGTDLFLRVASALALCNLAFRAGDGTEAPIDPARYADREIVDALLLVVNPPQHIPNFTLLKEPATRKLLRFTGQDFRGRSHAWTKWWEAARANFVGLRLQVTVTAANGERAVILWQDPLRSIRIRGEQGAVITPALPGPNDPPVAEYVLSGSEMFALVAKLKALGFMGPASIVGEHATEAIAGMRSLELELGPARARVAGPEGGARWLDSLETEILAVAAREQWQLYRDPVQEPDFRGFWRAEREWLSQHTDRREREQRLQKRIVRTLPALADAQAELALKTMLAFDQVGELLSEEDGKALGALAEKRGKIDGLAQRMLEAALLAPGDGWRTALDAVDRLHDNGGKEALPRLLGLLGPDRALQALSTGPRRVRIAAMHEAIGLKDLRVVPPLLAAMTEDDVEVASTAVYALGMLGDPRARAPLMERLGTAQLAPATRRELWVALGRIGGDGVLRLLQTAAASTDPEDRLKALQALGELHEPGATAVLAATFAAHGTDPVGSQALVSMTKHGALLARPALQRYLGARDARVRLEIVLALAEFQDPSVVPDLISLLDQPLLDSRAALLLSCITGVELTAVDDRVGFMREWWRRNKDLPQSAWFLDALRNEKVETKLAPEQLTQHGVAAVTELTAILLRANKPHLRVLTAAMLRNVTEQEFGNVSLQSTTAQLQAIADRYQFHAETERAKAR